MSAWKDLDLRWKALVYLAVTLIPAISGGTWLILNNMYWLEVKNSVSGLMNFVDAKQQGVIRFLGQNEKFAKELVVLVDKAPAESVGDFFRAVVETDVFKEEEHPFKDEIRAGKRKIPTWQVYRTIDYVEDGVVKVSSDPARVGSPLGSEPDARVGYSDVHMHNGVPEIAFRAKSANGEVIVHADARVLTNIVNGEIGNLEGDMGAFYLAGVGKTFDYYMTNTDNVLITESRVHPDALLRLKGSDFPWQRTLHGANDPACKNGVYETDARVMTGCREAMGFYESQDGKLMLGVSMPFYDSNWTIVVEQEADEILGPLFSLRNRIIVAAVVVLSLIVALSYVVLKRLMGRIDRVGGVVAAVAGGDLSVPEIPLDSRDEIGRIAENVNRMLGNLRSLVSNIRSSSGSVDNAATRLAAVTEETTHGVVQQQQEIEQVATAMNEMSATVQEVARNAVEAAESANATAGQTAEGNRIVSQTMDAINALAKEIDNATVVIHELETESNNIGTILDVIRGIAEQTNLLALNAAIEAARAGEQGRGFAVVADEVRTLAGRTQESTREIQEKIERLQAGTVQAVAAMQNSSQQAEASVQHAASAKESLDTITSSIDTINGRNTQIATAAEEQSHVAEEINKNVTNISQVAEQNAHGAQQVADSSDELTGLSHELQGMVERFRL